METLFRDLGVGVGIRQPHFNQILENVPRSLAWGEVISENFIDLETGERQHSLARLLQLREMMPLALHGVSMSLGSTDPLNFGYLKRLKKLIHEVNPAVVSDHLCWTGVNGKNLHDLYPLPYTEEALSLVVERISAVQGFLGRRLLIENVSSYIEYNDSEMSEWQFLTEVANRADCGLLLDVNNVFVSSVNHEFDPLKYISNLPLHRVGQIHLAGHSERDGFLIDTHDEPVRPEVWDLYRKTIQLTGLVSTMIERDENIPEWSILEKELHQIAEIRESTIRPKRTHEARRAAATAG